MVRLSGRLPDVDGQTVITALQRIVDGGPTHAANLALVCPTHHRFVHEHGWHIHGDPTRPDGLRFRRPDGRTYSISRPPVDPSVRARFPTAAGSRAQDPPTPSPKPRRDSTVPEQIPERC
jgi:hypothetical protein